MYIELRPGTGGAEALAFAKDLKKALVKYLATLKYQTETKENSTSIIRLKTNAPASLLDHLAGLHRVQRVSITDKTGRVHTSTVSIVMIPSSNTPMPVELDDKDIIIQTYRGTGTGGQKKNKTSSAVRLTHRPSGIVITREHGRSLTKNLEDAKADLVTRLTKIQQQTRQNSINHLRQSQVASTARSDKNFTWNLPRDEFINHQSGTTTSAKAALKGKF